MRYDGRFIGIESVEVTGEYKGLTAFGVSEMLRTLIKDKIEEEAHALANGNGGDGWQITALVCQLLSIQLVSNFLK
jgi:hypothetical protein